MNLILIQMNNISSTNEVSINMSGILCTKLVKNIINKNNAKIINAINPIQNKLGIIITYFTYIR